MKLSLCITTYNRYEMTIESFAKVINDPRIDDIVILDDCSADGSGERLRKHFINNDKVNVLFQVINKGMSINKRDAIKHAKNEWCIIFDSDNVIDTDYLDAFYNFCVADGGAMELFKRISDIEKFIFCPDFAKPTFDYRAYKCGNNSTSGWRSGIYRKIECAHEIKNDVFNCLMNTCNYIVNRDFYLATYQYNPEHIASDTIWHNYNHLKAGGHFVVVPDMQYFHRVHDGSGFMQDAAGNMARADKVRKLIQQL
jgi:glycosyltransferase involved in cell wall biosynthesis